jgi:hypothetical protein
MRVFVSVLIVLLIAFPCLAETPDGDYQCPNKIECRQRLYDNFGNSSEQTLGTMDVMCCYKVPIGCRPWHCKGDNTNIAYWQDKCNDRFPECRSNHHGYTDPSCMPHFKSYF